MSDSKLCLPPAGRSCGLCSGSMWLPFSPGSWSLKSTCGVETSAKGGGLGPSGSQAETTLLVQPHGPLAPGSPPYCLALFSNLTTPSCASLLDDHKPIWMHAEEREEMSKVSVGPSLGSPRLPGPLAYSLQEPSSLLLSHLSTSPRCPVPSPAQPAPQPPAISVLSSPASPPLCCAEPAPRGWHALHRVRRLVQGLPSEQVSCQ